MGVVFRKMGPEISSELIIPRVNFGKVQHAAKLLPGDANLMEHRGGCLLGLESAGHIDSTPETVRTLDDLVNMRCLASQAGRCRAIAICGLNVNEHLSPGAETF